MDVLEHTDTFLKLFYLALKKSNKYVLVGLPNEDYIMSRLRFIFGKGIMTHGLEMINTKPGHKHQWFIQYKTAYPLLANACKKLSAKKFLFISSGGANSSSSNFYLKLKGEIEDAVLKTKQKSLFILKPSLLIGKRKNSRFIESIGQIIMPLFSILLPDSIKAVKANTVAKCMLELAKSELSNLNIIENKEILSYR